MQLPCQLGVAIIRTILQRFWIPVVLAVMLIAGAATVVRLRHAFGSQQLPTYAGSMSESGASNRPKLIQYQVFSTAGMTADINYLDADGQPRQVEDAQLPWVVNIVTSAPSITANLVAQGTGRTLGCRISADGSIVAERIARESMAYVYCFSKSA